MDKPHGTKLDAGKQRWSLFPPSVLAAVLRVLEFGAAKYSVDNWKKVPDHKSRYYDAAMRHIQAWWAKERDDPESGESHLAHAVCCLMFLMWFDLDKADDGQTPSQTDPVAAMPEERKRCMWCMVCNSFHDT